MGVTTEKRTVLITGCSEGGLGFALAAEFHRRGCRVFATARAPEKAARLRDELGVETLALDVTDAASVRACAAEIARRTAPADGAVDGAGAGRLDLLVNNAGGGYQVPILDADLDEARRLFDVNLWGLVAVTQAFAPLLLAAAAAAGPDGPPPRVVNIGSVVGKQPAPWQGIYNATKGALASLSDTLRLELRPLGIEVLHVVTGGVATQFYSNARGQTLPSNSIYAPLAVDIERDVAGASAREAQSGCTPEAYARRVAGHALRPRSAPTLWVGGMAASTWAACRFGWDAVNDAIIEHMWGMGPLRKKFADWQAGGGGGGGGGTQVAVASHKKPAAAEDEEEPEPAAS